MKILFRTSGGKIPERQLGFGHIYRCINLCKELVSHKIIFLIEDYGSVSSILKENNLKFSKLKPGISENMDIEKSIKFIKKNKIDLVIVDKYGTTNKYFQAIKKVTKTVIISDLKNIQFDGDLLINGFIGYSNKIIHNKYDTKCLLGPKYQIINQNKTKKIYKHKKIDLLATFGGVDSSNIIPVLMNTLCHNSKKINTKIILGPSTKKNKKLTQLIQQKKTHVSVIQKTSDLMKEIGHTKFGFCGGGITSYEFAHMKVPFAIICQYPHQLITSREWQKLGIGLNLGLLNKLTPRKIHRVVNDLENIRNNLKTNHNIVDGLGSKRIAKEINKL
jgi:spore coat polysaccharide biosynthesis predicted glycosyltransferase SpsG